MAFAKYVIMSHLRCFSVTIALPHTILNPTGEQCATVKNLTRDLLKADINSSGNQRMYLNPFTHSAARVRL